MYTESFTTGVIIQLQYGKDFLVVSGRSYSQEGFERHIEAIFKGNYSDCSLSFVANETEWKRLWDEEKGAKT